MVVAAALGGVSQDVQQLHRLGARPPMWGFNPTLTQVVMPLFLHFGWLHWGCNVFLLAALALPLEVELGGAALIWLFLLSGAGSVLVSLTAHPQQTALGCSGAVFGFWGAVVVQTFRRDRREGLMQLALLGLGLWLSGSRLGVAHVDQSAHLGGLLLGALGYAAWKAGTWPRLGFTLLVGAAVGYATRGPHLPF